MAGRILECCVDTLEAAQNAVAGGANRIELCGDLVIGGTTPSRFLYEALRAESDVEIRAMVRPRFGDFLYSGSEFTIMLKTVEMFRELGCDGVVFGVLTPDGRLDVPHMTRLIEEAGEMKTTLHRAFDLTIDPFEALEAAKELGIDTILTSGQRNKCVDGAGLLRELVKRAGNIEILIGSGVDAKAVTELGRSTGARSFHLSGRVETDGPMLYRKPDVSMGLGTISEYLRWECSVEKIAAARAALDELD